MNIQTIGLVIIIIALIADHISLRNKVEKLSLKIANNK